MNKLQCETMLFSLTILRHTFFYMIVFASLQMVVVVSSESKTSIINCGDHAVATKNGHCLCTINASCVGHRCSHGILPSDLRKKLDLQKHKEVGRISGKIKMFLEYIYIYLYTYLLQRNDGNFIKSRICIVNLTQGSNQADVQHVFAKTQLNNYKQAILNILCGTVE